MMHFTDLLGIPYERHERDCLWISRVSLERIFPDFSGTELPSSAQEEEAALAAIDSGTSRWKVIGSTSACATQRGDLLHIKRDDGGSGVAVVIDRVGRVAITSTPLRGVHFLSIRRLQGVVAVLRRIR